MVCIRCWSDPYCHNLQSSLGVVCVRRNNSIKNVSNRVNTERVRCITSNSCHNRRWWRIKVTSQCRRESSFIKISIRSITIQAAETNLRRVVLRLRLVRHYALRQTFFNNKDTRQKNSLLLGQGALNSVRVYVAQMAVWTDAGSFLIMSLREPNPEIEFAFVFNWNRVWCDWNVVCVLWKRTSKSGIGNCSSRTIWRCEYKSG